MKNKNSENAVCSSHDEDDLITDNGVEMLYILNPVRAALASLTENDGGYDQDKDEGIIRGCDMKIQEAIELSDEIDAINPRNVLVKDDVIKILGVLHLVKGALDALVMGCFRTEEAQGVVSGCEMQTWKALKLVDKIMSP